MRKAILLIALIIAGAFTYAANDETPQKQSNKEESKDSGVIKMNKEMFVNNVFDYQTAKEWKYKGNKPAIIDLYADWCGPCRMVSPIMEGLAKEYENQVTFYKVNVDKEQELASLFNATSIPLLVFIPMDGQPQLFRGAADKPTYKKVIDEFLLKKKEAKK